MPDRILIWQALRRAWRSVRQAHRFRLCNAEQEVLVLHSEVRDLPAKVPIGQALRRAWRSVRHARTFRRSNAEQDVLVLQMGKVASSAFHEALLRHGFSSNHTHGIGVELSARRAQGLSRNDMTGSELSDTTAQHRGALRVNRLVHRYRQTAPATGRKVKVITILREPWAWYVSAFVERFPHVRQNLDQWWTRHGPPEAAADGLADRVARFQSVVNDLVLATDADMDSDPFAKEVRAAAAGRDDVDDLVMSTTMSLVRPLGWFDTDFRPMMQVDVYRWADQIRAGPTRIETDFADILVLRFESLGDSMDAVRTFLGTPTFRLRRVNVTGATEETKAVRNGVRAAASDAIKARLRATRYSRAFGYDGAD